MRTRISFKLIAAVGGAILVIFIVYATIVIKAQQEALTSRVEQSAHQLSETVKNSTKYDMLLNRRESVHRTIDDIGRQEGIDKVRIFNKEGTIIYSSDKEEVDTMVDKQAEACDICHSGEEPLKGLTLRERTRIFEGGDGEGRILGIINPINNEPGCYEADCHAHRSTEAILGVLDVTMSLDEVDRQIAADEKWMVMWAVSALVAISVLLWFLVQRLVGRPVSRLVEATNVVAAGNLEHQIRDGKKDELGYLGKSFNEMTQKLAEAQRQVVQYDKLASLGRLASGIAHEINNPLTGVLTYSSFLLKREELDPETKEDLEVIVRETKRCRQIVRGLLDFARQEPPHKGEVSVNEIVELAIGMFESHLSLSRVSIRKNLAPGLPAISADRNQIQQVLVNLLDNAADAIEDGSGEIRISTVEKDIEGDSFVAIGVEDTGCGIARKDLGRIFEPFFSTKGQKGTGLGLAVAWGIIDKHGGRIEVDSEPGAGSMFQVFLPAGGEPVASVEKAQAWRRTSMFS